MLTDQSRKIVKTYSDNDCPICGFPETVIVRIAKTMKPIREECSNSCGWERDINYD